MTAVGLLPSLMEDGKNASAMHVDPAKVSVINQPWGTRKPSRRRQEASIAMNRLLSNNNNTPDT